VAFILINNVAALATPSKAFYILLQSIVKNNTYIRTCKGRILPNAYGPLRIIILAETPSELTNASKTDFSFSAASEPLNPLYCGH